MNPLIFNEDVDPNVYVIQVVYEPPDDFEAYIILEVWAPDMETAQLRAEQEYANAWKAIGRDVGEYLTVRWAGGPYRK